jgi:plastocyanin
MRPYARRNNRLPPLGLALLFGSGCIGLMYPSWGAVLAITVVAPDGHPLPGMVVTAYPGTGPTHPAPPVAAVMDQVNRSFAPDLLIIPVSSTVTFPNSDSVSHQIYSFSPAKRFQLPLYRGKPYPPTHFDQAGIVTLGCNIHDEMLAYVVVTDAPYFGRTAANGTWSAQVPNGRYRISIWHPRIRDEDKDDQAEVTVADTDGTLTLRLKRTLKPPPLEGRPHTWDQY